MTAISSNGTPSEPAAQVGHRRRVGVAQPEPGLLHGVLRVAHRSEHAVGDRLGVVAAFAAAFTVIAIRAFTRSAVR
jgi:hypothetical protein